MVRRVGGTTHLVVWRPTPADVAPVGSGRIATRKLPRNGDRGSGSETLTGPGENVNVGKRRRRQSAFRNSIPRLIFGQGAGEFQKALCGGGQTGVAARKDLDLLHVCYIMISL
jgi:hypothetical protein